jgi:hypothetical protein
VFVVLDVLLPLPVEDAVVAAYAGVVVVVESAASPGAGRAAAAVATVVSGAGVGVDDIMVKVMMIFCFMMNKEYWIGKKKRCC